MKSRLIIIFAVMLCAYSAHAQKDQFNPVHTGVTSLSIAPDARAGAMGDVGVATEPDVNSQYWNPAKYPFCIARAGLSMSYTPWLRQLVSDIDLAYVAGFYRIGEYSAVSGSLTYFSLGEVFADEYTIKPYEFAVDVAYSRMLSETFSAAVALRYIHSDLQYDYAEDMEPASAFAADIALYYNNYIMIGNRECLLGLGANISNIGSKISYDGGNTNEFIPTNLRIGGSILIPIDEYNTIAISADLNKLLVPTRPTYEQFLEEMQYESGDNSHYSEYQDWLTSEGYNDISSISGIFKSFNDAPGGFGEELKEIYGGIGVEYCYNQQFTLRGGYHYEHEFKGNRKYYTLGAGFKMSVFSLDAAYLISAAQSNPLDQTLRFSLSFDMDGLRDMFGRR
ncbi:MAG: type IX secretion system outer membrane channel protein PorV [Bacteroidaceae bacterium]|nr:type IX secretion system outer membrane channel protein PorV [Bacteroidales bacterium]MBQ3622381.1 type IX secretion system outer membrane channel protein PorV [Bacteroidaceae bacterium]MBR7134070.1 type IX secretion system outer membrane channel protein PorV [Bacteroidaceae bacterium]